MSTAIIKKSELNGSVKAPASKSVAHRMMLCAALSRSKCYIHNITDSDDMSATIGCLSSLGAKITKEGTTVFIDATSFASDKTKHYTLNCIESGTTLRIMIPVCAALGLHVTFIGEGKLPQRPLDEYLTLLPKHSVEIEKGDSSLPLTIKGQLCGDVFSVSPKVSSQYVTGLIFALSLLKNDCKLNLLSELVGGQYVDITTSVMKKFGVTVVKTRNSYSIKGMQKYTPASDTLNVEGDWSQAAFFLCCGAIKGSITVTNIDTKSTQGDKKIIDFLKAFNADITINDDSVSVRKSNLIGTDIDATDTPDLVPVLSVLASFAQGETNIHGVSRLKFKESDRLLSTSQMINSLGGCATYTDDCMTIKSTNKLTGGDVDGFNDHRIVMSSAIAGAFCENTTTIRQANAVNKSYTNFFDDYKSLGGICDVIMGK